MNRLLAIIVLTAALALAACGQGDTTTVINGASGPSGAQNTGWGQTAQQAFLGGCGTGQYCYCVMHELEQIITESEIIAASNPVATYHDEIIAAAKECI